MVCPGIENTGFISQSLVENVYVLVVVLKDLAQVISVISFQSKKQVICFKIILHAGFHLQMYNIQRC